MRTRSVVIVAEGGNACTALAAMLNQRGCQVTVTPEHASVSRILRDTVPDLVLLLSQNGGSSNTASAEIQRVATLMLPTSTSASVIADAVDNALGSPDADDRQRGPLPYVSAAAYCAEDGDAALVDGHRLMGANARLRQLRTYIRNVAMTDTNVLITGETGTGKELVAELIHRNSRRRQKPFACLNCAAIPDSLLESELFGFERGAFTGAFAKQRGKIETANGGTIFFDEIGEMTLYAQAKLLRVIDSHELQRLGSTYTMHADIRIIAATNRDLDGVANPGAFRRDLYYRLNVARIHLPPLRERVGDVPLLIDHYIACFNRQFGRRVRGFVDSDLPSLLRYEWPGNIRELKNVVESAFVTLPAAGVEYLEIPPHVRPVIVGQEPLPPSEQDRLLQALWATAGNRSRAARSLNWSRMTLYRKMLKYGLADKKLPPRDAAR